MNLPLKSQVQHSDLYTEIYLGVPPPPHHPTSAQTN